MFTDNLSCKYGDYNPKIIAERFNNEAEGFLKALEKGACVCCNEELSGFYVMAKNEMFPFSIFASHELKSTPRLPEDKHQEFCSEFASNLKDCAMSLFTFSVAVLYVKAIENDRYEDTYSMPKVFRLFSNDFIKKFYEKLDIDISGISEIFGSKSSELKEALLLSC